MLIQKRSFLLFHARTAFCSIMLLVGLLVTGCDGSSNSTPDGGHDSGPSSTDSNDDPSDTDTNDDPGDTDDDGGPGDTDNDSGPGDTDNDGGPDDEDGGGPNTGEGDLDVWTISTRDKIQPTTALGSGDEIVLAGPRKSYQTHQIVVHAQSEGLLGVKLTASALADGAGNTIDASHVVMFRQWFVDFENTEEFEGREVYAGVEPVPEHSPTADTHVPDPLIPLIDPYEGTELGHPFDVSANRNQPIWVDVFIPENTVAGTYTGDIVVEAGNGDKSTIGVTLDVWNLDLPDMTS
ncbi:MAG: hypothetical protein GY847_15655, partial [Proteobacteria bacterium]|nr:hypothetical protein [Pseudomonadota bacterium]